MEISVFEAYIGQLAEQLYVLAKYICMDRCTDPLHDSFKLASEAQNLVGKRAVLDCLAVLIERVKEKVGVTASKFAIVPNFPKFMIISFSHRSCLICKASVAPYRLFVSRVVSGDRDQC